MEGFEILKPIIIAFAGGYVVRILQELKITKL